MTLQDRTALSFYREIATLNKEHGVFLVQHTETNRVFVKKTLTVYDLGIFRFLKDYPIPHTPRIYELIEDGNVLILIEEYIDGTSLEDLLNIRTVLTEQEAVHITRQLCEILRYLERITPPIVHRDIKPANIILSDRMEVTLLDLDAAKWVDPQRGQDTVLLGTYGYAAPEQYGFRSSDIRTDLYAVGVVLNRMLTGEFPQVRRAEGRLAPVIEKCTRIEASDRYASADELIDALNVALHSDVVSVPEPERKGWVVSLPGIRSGKIATRVYSALGYIVLLGGCLSMPGKGTEPEGVVWANRVISFCFFMSFILISGNYRGLLDALRINRIQNRFLRVTAIVIIDLMAGMIWLELLRALESNLA